MIEKLEEIGFEFELADENIITESDTIITPDGEEIIPEVEFCENMRCVTRFDFDKTVFEWFLDMFDGYDAFFESCEDDEDEANTIQTIEKSIEECDILGGDAGTEGDGLSFCMHITVKNGTKTIAILNDDDWDGETCLGFELETPADCELTDKYGKKKVEKL